MLVKIIRFIRGSITCSAKGKFTERLINILNKKGFTYWNIIPCEGGLSFSLNGKEYKRLRYILRGTGIKTRITKKSGVPFIIKKYRSRTGLIIGAVVFIALIVLFSKFIWITTVSGNDQVETTKILSVLRDNGLYSGVYIKSIDNKALERKVIEEIPDIRWISVNITGCKAEVELKERYKTPKILDKKEICNIKASKDALILKTNVTNGTGVVKKGSAVVKGQLLISGIITGVEGGSRFVPASGKIIGRTTYHKTYSLPKKKTMVIPTGREEERARGNLLWFSVPLNFNYIPFDSYRTVVKTDNLNVNDVDLPVSVTRECVREMEKKEIYLKENKDALQKIARLSEAFEFRKKKIENRGCKYSEDKNNYYLKIKYTVRENICTKSPLMVGE